jgi:hypothetical protein
VKLVLNWGHFKKEIFSSKYEENIHIWWINEMTLSLNIIVASELLWQIYKPMERRYIIIFSKLFLIIYYSYLHRYISIHSYFIFLQLKSLYLHFFPSSKCPIHFWMCKKNVRHEFRNKRWLILTSIDLYGTKAAVWRTTNEKTNLYCSHSDLYFPTRWKGEIYRLSKYLTLSRLRFLL